MQFLTDAVSSIGSSRKTNQDSVLLKNVRKKERSFLMASVCDGMGGLKNGDCASATVVYALNRWFNQSCEFLEDHTSLQDLCTALKHMIEALNTRFKEYEVSTGVLMGTTMSSLLILDDDFCIVHIGDSRVYKIGKTIQILTSDDTVTAEAVARGAMTESEAAVSKEQHKLTQCFGASVRFQPHITYGKVQPDDVFLICSDGFRHHIGQQEIAGRFTADSISSEAKLRCMLDSTVNLVMQRGERDNISAAVVCAL